MAQQIQALTLDDAVAAGLLARTSDRLGDLPVRAAAGSGLSNGTLILHVSPDASHRALIWLAEPADLEGPTFWIDGRRLAAAQQATPPGHWAGNHIYAIELAAESQPAQRSGSSTSGPTGYDLLLYNAATAQVRVESANAQAPWPAPWACISPSGMVAIYADQRESAAAPVRRLNWPT